MSLALQSNIWRVWSKQSVMAKVPLFVFFSLCPCMGREQIGHVTLLQHVLFHIGFPTTQRCFWIAAGLCSAARLRRVCCSQRLTIRTPKSFILLVATRVQVDWSFVQISCVINYSKCSDWTPWALNHGSPLKKAVKLYELVLCLMFVWVVWTLK